MPRTCCVIGCEKQADGPVVPTYCGMHRREFQTAPDYEPPDRRPRLADYVPTRHGRYDALADEWRQAHQVLVGEGECEG